MKAPLWVTIVIIIVAGGAWYLFSGNSSYAPTTPSAGETSLGSSDATTSVPAAVVSPTIAYTDDGFSPVAITVPVGTTVTFVNRASDQMYVASNPHPAHQGYDGTTRVQHCAAEYQGPAPLDECLAASPGGSWTFTFTKAGAWGFHNHASPNEGGTVTVR